MKTVGISKCPPAALKTDDFIRHYAAAMAGNKSQQSRRKQGGPNGIATHRAFKIGLVIAIGLASAVLPAVFKHGFSPPYVASASSQQFTYVNGYAQLNGNYVDCYGNVDNDPGHHTTNPNDADPAHHVGYNCPSGTPAGDARIAQLADPGASSSPISSASLLPSTSFNTVQTSAPATSVVSIWWPVDGVTVSGIQPFKAALAGANLSTYAMYWQVDGGQQNKMNDSNADAPHKEASVDISNWTWKGGGPYQVNFTAKDSNGNVVASKVVNIYVPSSLSTVVQTSTVTPSDNQISAVPAFSGYSGNPFANVNFYVNANSNAGQQASAWRSYRPQDAVMMDKIAQQSVAAWLGPWSGDAKSAASSLVSTASSQNALPIIIAYNLPNRDCGGYSAGGAQDSNSYKQWIDNLASGIGNRRAVVVLEPDGLALTSCLSGSDLQARYDMLKYAVNKLKSLGNTAVYLDAGHAHWVSPDEMASKLKNAGIVQSDGFALNISNFTATQDNVNYGQEVSAKVGGKHFIIDTSRNGNGSAPDGQWCNPTGRALGIKPTANTGNGLVDAFIWGKQPGESDGACNGGPSAGVWWADYALGLAQRASW